MQHEQVSYTSDETEACVLDRSLEIVPPERIVKDGDWATRQDESQCCIDTVRDVFFKREERHTILRDVFRFSLAELEH